MNIKNIAALVVSLSLVACSDNQNETTTNVVRAVDVVVATTASDYSSASHSGLQRGIDGTFRAENNLVSTANSDVTLASYGDYFYRIEKFTGENITKFSFHQPTTPIWQFSTKDNANDAVSSNPVNMIFVNNNKAYILRYGKTKVWIVNPSALREEDFKIGELDLSAYGNNEGDTDGIPEMSNGIVVNGKLFISMQRLDRNAFFAPNNDAYVAVFNVDDDSEIDTDPNTAGLNGIRLSSRNPYSDVVYLAEDNSIYINGIGNTFPLDPSGGIEKINVDSYVTTVVLDDGVAGNVPYGQMAGFAIKSSTQAYFIGYDAFDDNSLYSLNPSNGVVVKTNIAALQNTSISSISFDKEGDLWVSNGADANVYVIDTTDDTTLDVINTELNPGKVVFE